MIQFAISLLKTNYSEKFPNKYKTEEEARAAIFHDTHENYVGTYAHVLFFEAAERTKGSSDTNAKKIGPPTGSLFPKTEKNAKRKKAWR